MRARSLPAGSCPSYTTGYSGALLANLHYDPLGRLSEALKYTAGTLTRTTRFLYDGDALVLEYDGTGAILNRYVHGSNAQADDPLLWYPGSSTADANARNLYADPRGSIVLVEGQDGTVAAINTYDEWGANGATNLGRFQYTGQVWLDELGMYYYKARIYSPRLGRFMQTDPIGYADQMDLYAYVGNDPVDGVDFSGDETASAGSGGDSGVTGDFDKQLKEHPVVVGASTAAFVVPLAAAAAPAAATGGAGAVVGEVENTAATAASEDSSIIAQHSGSHAVYSEAVEGVTRYVGRTGREISARAAEHLRASGRVIKPLVTGLSLHAAKAVEQVLIEAHGLAKEGGSLANRINSIAKSNPIYKDAIELGKNILEELGMK